MSGRAGVVLVLLRLGLVLDGLVAIALVLLWSNALLLGWRTGLGPTIATVTTSITTLVATVRNRSVWYLALLAVVDADIMSVGVRFEI